MSVYFVHADGIFEFDGEHMSTIGVPFPKIEAVTFRELRPEETERLMPFLKAQGWGIPYPYQSSAVIAEYEGQIVGFAVVQLVPMVGPFWIAESWRGSGLAEMVAGNLRKHMITSGFGPCISVVNNVFVERLCRLLGMKEVEGKLFVKE